MKKTILTLAAILLASLSFAQGGGFNYKALITDNGNVLNTQPVTFKFTVLENGTTSVYQETQSATTDTNGIVAVNVGEGTLVSGNFNTIDWGSNPYFLKVEIDTGSGYQDFGTTEFKAVPYAKFAEKAGNAFSGDFSALSNVPAGLSDGDDDTHLTESQVDSYVSNNGYLTQVDNIRGIPVSSTAPTNGQILKYNGSQFVPADDDTSGGSGTDGVVNSAAFSGTTTKTLTLGRSNGLGNVTANFTDNDTHLTDAQIGAMGYIKNANDADHDATNEIQNLTLNSTQLSISNGNNVNFTGWDTNAADDFDGDFTSLSNVPAGLSDGDDDTHLTDAQIGAMGYIKNANDADHDATNEIQNLTLNSTQLSISNGNNVNFSGWDTDASDDVQNIDDLTDAKNDGSSIFIGTNAGANSTAPDTKNVGVGSYALQSNTYGEDNVAYGTYSLSSNTIGGANTAIGSGAGNSNQTGNYNIFLGYNAGFNETGSNKLYIENSDSATPLIGGDFSTDEVTINGSIAIKDGTQGSGKVLTSDATGKASWVTPTVGATQLNELSDARSDNDGTDNGSSIFIGVNAGANDDQSNNKNVGLGYHALYTNTTGFWNTASGYGALSSNTTGHSNTANGASSLYSNTTGNYNTASGKNSLKSNTIGFSNTASGVKSLYSNTTGFINTASGLYSLYSNTTGNRNTTTGVSSLYSNTSGSNNTAVGYKAGYSNQTGDGNIFLGNRAGYTETGSNKLYIENSDSATPLIGGDFSTDEVTINGDLEVTQNIKGKIKAEDSGNTDMKAYIYGSITSSGGYSSVGAHSDGFSVTRTSTGVYTITFNGTHKPTSSSQYTVMANMRLDNIGFITVHNNGSTFTIRTYNTSGTAANRAFNFVVYKK